MPDDGIGVSVRRKEDFRFLTGRGTYTDDINRPGQVYAWFVRSPHAHARIKGIDASKATAAPGVIALFTGADMVSDGVGSLPCGWQIHSKDGSPMLEPPHIPLAPERARHVGDQVAVVIALTRDQARDGAELVEVDWEELDAVTNVDAADGDGAPQVWDDVPANTCFDWHLGDKEAVDAAFAGAAHVVRIDIINNRLIPNAIEPRAGIAEFDPATDEYTLYTTSQNPHVIRLLMGAYVLSLPEHKLRVVSPDVGGGFGSKIFHYAEEAILTWAAGKVKRPIKWTAERTESFVTDAHGRDHATRAELALDADGTFLAMRVSTKANMGAYLSTFAPCVPTYLYGTLLSGQYRTPAIYCEVKAVFTNTTPVDAVRGAGRPEASYVVERLVDESAQVLKLDQVEIRRRNFVPKDGFPFQTAVAFQYDSGDYEATLDEALQAADYAGFEARRKEAEGRGKLRGIGLSAYIEACGIAPSAVAGSLGARAGLYEAANVRVDPTGTVTVFTGSHSHGQGHETTFAQIVAERLGIPIDNVVISHGDTAKVPFGMGTYGSRSLAVGGSALMRAIDKIVAKATRIAAHLMEASAEDVEFKDGAFTVAGTDKSVGFADVALTAYVPHNFPHEELEPGLEESAFYDPANFTFPAGTHVCEVEVDPETGVVEVVSFTAADDFGRVINPMIVEGQIQGGVAHGLGQALLEGCVYDDRGQLVTGSYLDYCMPRASDQPGTFNVDVHDGTLCTHNPLGVKGCGEAGTIGAPAAAINAVLDALRPVGVTHLEMPATSGRVWRAMQAAKAA